MIKQADYIKLASIYDVTPYEAAFYYSFVDELESRGYIEGFEKEAMLGNLLAKGTAALSTSMPKTFAALSGASNKLSQAAVNNPMFNHAMMTGDFVGMGATAGAGALQGVSKLYKGKKGMSLKKLSKGMEASSPIITAAQSANLAKGSKFLDMGADLVDTVSNGIQMIS